MIISYYHLIFLSSDILSHYIIYQFNKILLRKIHWYSTAATDEAAYIIGGYQDTNYSRTIAAFKNDQWRKLDDLTQGRCVHASISIGQQTMIVGGQTVGLVFKLIRQK